MNDAFYQVVLPIVEALEDNSIAYYIGGSVASIAYGMPRSTMDVDIAVDIAPKQLAPLLARLAPLGYIDEPAAQDALRFGGTFNLIPFSGPAKIDFFLPKRRPFDQAIFERVRYVTLHDNAPRPIALPSPEDIVLLKLEWYEATNRASLHQWPDVLGVLQGQAEVLDRVYLQHWAKILGLDSLLHKAYAEAGLSMSP